MTATKTGIDPRLVKAMGHPVRLQVLTLLNEGIASPNEMAQELGESIGNVAYHTRYLLDLGCIELVKTEPRRGAVEHFYRAIVRPFLSDEQFMRLPASLRRTVADSAVDLIWRDVAEDVRTARWEARADRHLSRTPLQLDDVAYRELSALTTTLLDRALELESESAGRAAEVESELYRAKLVMMLYGEADANADDAESSRAKRRNASRGKSRRSRGKAARP